MMDNSAYLLRCKWQTQQFKTQYAEIIENSADKMFTWFNSLALYEWHPLPWQGHQIKAAVGILCILFQEGRINLCFDTYVTRVMRYANTDDEYEQYIQKTLKQK